MTSCRLRVALAVVLVVGAAVRAVNWAQVSDGAILYFHRWEQSDMHFFHQWGQAVAGGALLAAPRPYHRWHGEVAQQVFAREHPGQPFDEREGRALWERWLGTRAYYQDPLYAYVLGAFYRALGARVEPVLAAQAVMGLGACALVFALGFLLDGRWTAIVSGLMAALYAPLVFYEGTLLRGVLQALLSLALVAFVQYASRAPRPRPWWAMAGVAGGLLAVTHSTGLLLVAALVGVIVRGMRGRPRREALLLYAAGACAALLPFAVRNVMVGLPPLASPAYGPVNFIISNASDRNPWIAFQVSAHTDEILQQTDGRLWPVMRATLATHPGPGSWLRLTLRKLLVFLNWRETADNINFAYYLLQAPLVSAIGLRFGLVAPLAGAGLVLAGRGRLRRALPLLLGIASGLLVAVVFFTSSRLRLTTALMLVPFAALALVEAARRLRARRWPALAAPAALGAGLAALVLLPGPAQLPDIRDSDYGVGGVIAVERARARAERGDEEGALRTLAVQLRTEPPPLRAAQPGQPLPLASARAASFFVDLHRMAAALYARRGDREEEWQHARHAQLLEAIAAQYAARQP